MRMVYGKYGIDIKLQENSPTVIYIESQKAYSDCVRDLWLQCNGQEGEWIFSFSEDLVSVSKVCEFIINPWALDSNNKKVITKLYQEIQDLAYEKYLDIYGDLNSKIVNFLDTLAADIPYEIEVSLEPEFSSLLKIYNVKVENDDSTLLEKITSYVRIMSRICGVKIFIFVGLKGFLPEEEILEFYKMAGYEKVFPVLIEHKYTKALDEEKTYILDSELCVIEV